MAGLPRIEDLRAEARYHGARYDLYRAKMSGLRPTTMARLRELERMHRGADARLRGVASLVVVDGPRMAPRAATGQRGGP
jgi:hypothetical protein